jgi:hypothetical protein
MLCSKDEKTGRSDVHEVGTGARHNEAVPEAFGRPCCGKICMKNVPGLNDSIVGHSFASHWIMIIQARTKKKRHIG